MRFARSAAAGLGVGMLAGFAVALVRPRTSSSGPAAAPAAGTTTGRSPWPPGRAADATTSDVPAGPAAGTDLTGRVI
jgi:hypothetical protein